MSRGKSSSDKQSRQETQFEKTKIKFAKTARKDQRIHVDLVGRNVDGKRVRIFKAEIK